MSLSKIIALARLIAQRGRINGRSFNPDGFHSWAVGEIRITKVVEMTGEGFGEFLIPDARREKLSAIGWMHPGHLGPRGGLRLSVHSFVIETGGKRILVDTNVGNNKKRKVPIWNRMSMPWLDDLQRAGFPPETIDIVLCTHLHIDHVGWNTVFDNGAWRPTFPNARYVFVRDEYAYWKARLDDPARAELFADSIEPVVAAGQVDLVSRDAQIAPGLRLVPTPGHTEDHVALRIESNGRSGLITGDFVHHPAQFAHPEWSSSFDTSPGRSIETRRAMFEELASSNTLILGTAFPDPTAGHVVREGTHYRFESVEPL